MKTDHLDRRIIKSEQQDIKLNCTLLENPDSRGLCVIFPGKGYTADKPLLYYSIRTAMAHGYDLLILSYGEFTMNESTRYTMKNLIQGVVRDALTEGGKKGEGRKGDLIFISKSIGALFASDVAITMEHETPIRCVYLTPIDEMVPNMARTDFLAFTGSEDHLLDQQRTLNELREASWRLRVYNGADHSLNSPDPDESIRILSEVIGKIKDFIQ